jgi:hypothetical protein
MTSFTDTLLPIIAVVGGLFGFVAIWSGVGLLLGFMSGWHHLAARHRTRRDPPVHSQLTSGMLNLVRYNGVLRLAGTHEGLDMRTMALFRMGHPPLLVPWSEIRVLGEDSRFFIRYTKVQLGERGPVLLVRPEVWEQLGAFHPDRR